MCSRNVKEKFRIKGGSDLYYILVFLQTVSQKIGREGQLIILGVGRSGKNALRILKSVFCVTVFSQRVHIQKQNS